jgi:hypothetical protein
LIASERARANIARVTAIENGCACSNGSGGIDAVATHAKRTARAVAADTVNAVSCGAFVVVAAPGSPGNRIAAAGVAYLVTRGVAYAVVVGIGAVGDRAAIAGSGRIGRRAVTGHAGALAGILAADAVNAVAAGALVILVAGVA